METVSQRIVHKNKDVNLLQSELKAMGEDGEIVYDEDEDDFEYEYEDEDWDENGEDYNEEDSDERQ